MIVTAPAHTSSGFCLGAILMMDALGFRGIWGRVGLQDLLTSLQELARKTTSDVEDLAKMLGGVRPVLDLRLLSDTVVLTVAHDIPFGAGPGEVRGEAKARMVPVASLSVETAAAFASILQARAVLQKVPLLFRGAIGFGEFLVQENFLIGPAVDEVAEAHQLADGSIVWLLPSASEALRTAPREGEAGRMADLVLRDGIELPLRVGSGSWATVVNPVSAPGLPPDIGERFLAAFGPRPQDEAVERKRENTRRFLAAIAATP